MHLKRKSSITRRGRGPDPSPGKPVIWPPFRRHDEIIPEFLYLVRCTNCDIYKIGVTNNPTQRLSAITCQLRCKSAELPLCLHTILTNHGAVLERRLHERFAATRIGCSEWFRLTGEQVADLYKIASVMFHHVDLSWLRSEVTDKKFRHLASDPRNLPRAGYKNGVPVQPRYPGRPRLIRPD